jgi:RNA recognition motif-containing protein
MDVKLYVGNLPYDTTEDAIREMFTEFGAVTSVALIKDRATGYSKGFGFVEMSSQKEAQNAISALNGKTVGDRQLTVNFAKPREERPSFGSGGGRRDRDSGRRRRF